MKKEDRQSEESEATTFPPKRNKLFGTHLFVYRETRNGCETNFVSRCTDI